MDTIYPRYCISFLVPRTASSVAHTSLDGGASTQAGLKVTIRRDDRGPCTHDLPPRIKLRVNDATTWVDAVCGAGALAPSNVVCPPREWQPTQQTPARPDSDSESRRLRRNPATDHQF